MEFGPEDAEGQRRRGEVTTVSATGLAFTLVDVTGVEAGASLEAARIRIDGGHIEGDLMVLYSRSAADSGTEFGCMFYPASAENSALWRNIVSGLPGLATPPQPHLPIRCTNCHYTLWISDDGRSSHRCRECEQEYDLGRTVRGRHLENLHQRARAMAGELRIDLASAVSMLLGMLTLPEVQDILDEAPPAEPLEPTSDTGRTGRFDRAFAPAVEAGSLTAAQATLRGNREAFAKKLVARHRISLDGAYDVADNRTSLLTLMRRREAGDPIEVRYARPAAPTLYFAVAAMFVIALLSAYSIVRQLHGSTDRRVPVPVPAEDDFAAHTARTGARPAPQGPPRDRRAPDLAVASYARVEADDFGKVFRVEATDPTNVLTAFCRSHDPVRRLEAVRVIPTEPPSAATRLGLLRDLDEEKGYRVIVIRQDSRTRRWFVGQPGDAQNPVTMIPASEELVLAELGRI